MLSNKSPCSEAFGKLQVSNCGSCFKSGCQNLKSETCTSCTKYLKRACNAEECGIDLGNSKLRLHRLRLLVCCDYIICIYINVYKGICFTVVDIYIYIYIFMYACVQLSLGKKLLT